MRGDSESASRVTPPRDAIWHANVLSHQPPLPPPIALVALALSLPCVRGRFLGPDPHGLRPPPQPLARPRQLGRVALCQSRRLGPGAFRGRVNPRPPLGQDRRRPPAPQGARQVRRRGTTGAPAPPQSAPSSLGPSPPAPAPRWWRQHEGCRRRKPEVRPRGRSAKRWRRGGEGALGDHQEGQGGEGLGGGAEGLAVTDVVDAGGRGSSLCVIVLVVQVVGDRAERAVHGDCQEISWWGARRTRRGRNWSAGLAPQG